MAQFFHIHQDNPQSRLLKQVVQILQRGGLVVYPTDSSYAIGCHIGDKEAMRRIGRIRSLSKDHNYTLVGRDISQLSQYFKMTNEQFRLIRACTPGAYTFILPATREVPRRLQHPKRRTIGFRIPDNRIVQDLLALLAEPIISSTLILPNALQPMGDPDDIRAHLEHQVDVVIDGGHGGSEPTTVVAWTGENPEIVREGRGDPSPFR
jgi:tRNA threonylcarbamoyl adenosine modification protein (Sua5/YciO/YrdC/YwlC family)